MTCIGFCIIHYAILTLREGVKGIVRYNIIIILHYNVCTTIAYVRSFMMLATQIWNDYNIWWCLQLLRHDFKKRAAIRWDTSATMMILVAFQCCVLSIILRVDGHWIDTLFFCIRSKWSSSHVTHFLRILTRTLVNTPEIIQILYYSLRFLLFL